MQPDISVVVPMKNEAPNVEKLYRELTAALEAYGRPYEILTIDDGSTDETFAVLARVQAADPRLRVIRFRRNFGQTAGFAAGFAHARGRYIVTMDGDLQNDPRDIPAMVKLLEERPADIVAGWRKDRKDKFFSRRLPSMVANRVISKATGVALHDYGCSLKVFRAEVVKPMKLYGEMHRFLPAIASEFGVTTIETVVNHRAREHGASKYGISRTIRVILDLLTVKFLISYRTRPVQIFGLWGLVMGFVGTLILGWLAYVRLTTTQGIADRPILLFGILLIFTGVQLVTLGLLAEMQARTYHESQDKPTYVIREVRQADALASPGSPKPRGSEDGPAPPKPRSGDPRITDIQREFGAQRSRRQRYADLVVGQPGFWPLLRYELTVLLSGWVPGALGLFLRSKLYPLILGHVGKNVAFGANIVLRHPHKISIDDNVVVDDNCCLDAKGTTNRGIVLKRGVFLGRNTILSCKNGNILLDEEANIGFNVEVFSAADVRIGRKVLVAAYTYLVGGDHLYDRVDVPVLEQGRTARGIEVDDNVWLGAHVVVADGVRIGRDAVIGAGAVVTGDIPEFHVAAGVPARVLRDRRMAKE